MRRRIGIVTASKEMGEEYKRQLESVFPDDVEIINYAFIINFNQKIDDVDVLLISTYSQYEIIKRHIALDVKVVISKKTISKQGADLLKQTTGDKQVMLVNLSYEMCIDSIASLLQLGFDEYDFVPVYPNMEQVPNLKIAITPGESLLIPKGVEIICDIGHRYLDKNTLVDIAFGLSLEDVLSSEKMVEYCKKLATNDKGIDFLIGQSKAQTRQIHTLLSIMEKGVICVNGSGLIESCNFNARKLIRNRTRFIGKHIEEILPITEGQEICEIKTNKLVTIDGNNITVSIYPMNKLIMEGEAKSENGVIIILENFESQEVVQNQLRLQLTNKGHIAKYDVSSIIGTSRGIIDVKKLILRMGNSKSPVLITGESGTGKELVAQAMHNESPIRSNQFVAVNCAAISSNLLESELFGYEGGAFTGASKKGKAGIFELAHNGTLFLDEIGEMPLELQTKLLRVIQENEVMRVGGHKIIKVNVRIISATNRDLYKEVKNGTFRKDLYYRLNVLPINVPPLRQRGEDILYLINHFKLKLNCTFELDKRTIDFLEKYSWPGNIRELKNCIEYLDNMESQLVKVEHLPHYMLSSVTKEDIESQPNEFENFNKNESFVLTLFYTAFKEKRKLGRRSISEKAFENNLFLSEYDVRGVLNSLKMLGYIEVQIGRSGSFITKKGVDFVEKHI